MKRKMFALFLCVMMYSFSYAQVKNLRLPAKFEPFTYEELIIMAQIEAQKRAQFEENQDLAYEAINRGNWYGFIYYSNRALSTGYYNSKMYYYRGVCFEKMDRYKDAKKEYRKAKRKGYYGAKEALSNLKKKKY